MAAGETRKAIFRPSQGLEGKRPDQGLEGQLTKVRHFLPLDGLSLISSNP